MEATRKKVRVIGTQKYLNTDTNEVCEMQVIDIEERDANFHKLWLGHIIQSIDLIGNQKTKLAFWILDNLDYENKLTMTYRQIADKSNMSYQTVYRTMKALVESNFLIKINGGAYRVNPDVIFKGGKTARLNVLFKYHDEAKQARIDKIKKAMEAEEKSFEETLEEHGQERLIS